MNRGIISFFGLLLLLGVSASVPLLASNSNLPHDDQTNINIGVESVSVYETPETGYLTHSSDLSFWDAIDVEQPDFTGSLIQPYADVKDEVNALLVGSEYQDMAGNIVGVVEYFGAYIIVFGEGLNITEVVFDQGKTYVIPIETIKLGDWKSPIYEQTVKYNVPVTDDILIEQLNTRQSSPDCDCDTDDLQSKLISEILDGYDFFLQDGVWYSQATVTHKHFEELAVYVNKIVIPGFLNPTNDGDLLLDLFTYDEAHSEIGENGDVYGRLSVSATFYSNGQQITGIYDYWSTSQAHASVCEDEYYTTSANYGSYGYTGGDCDWDGYLLTYIECGCWITCTYDGDRNTGGYGGWRYKLGC